MSKYFFPKGKMVIHTPHPKGGHVVWFKNGRGRGRWIVAGHGVVDSPEYAEETYTRFTEMGTI